VNENKLNKPQLFIATEILNFDNNLKYSSHIDNVKRSMGFWGKMDKVK